MNGNRKKLFNLASFIEDFKEDVNNRMTVERYEKNFGKMPKNMYDFVFYQNYLQFFEPVNYKTPEELKDDFNWDLLLKLVAGSFSSEYELVDGELYITVSSTDVATKETTTIKKTVSELWHFQILRLFEIYISEQIGMCTTIYLPDETTDSSNKSFFINNGPKYTMSAQHLKGKIASFNDFYSMYSCFPIDYEGKEILMKRYNRIIEYRIKAAQSDDLDKIFIKNPNATGKKKRDSNYCPF